MKYKLKQPLRFQLPLDSVVATRKTMTANADKGMREKENLTTVRLAGI